MTLKSHELWTTVRNLSIVVSCTEGLLVLNISLTPSRPYNIYLTLNPLIEDFVKSKII